MAAMTAMKNTTSILYHIKKKKTSSGKRLRRENRSKMGLDKVFKICMVLCFCVIFLLPLIHKVIPNLFRDLQRLSWLCVVCKKLLLRGRFPITTLGNDVSFYNNFISRTTTLRDDGGREKHCGVTR